MKVDPKVHSHSLTASGFGGVTKDQEPFYSVLPGPPQFFMGMRLGFLGEGGSAPAPYQEEPGLNHLAF